MRVAKRGTTNEPVARHPGCTNEEADDDPSPQGLEPPSASILLRPWRSYFRSTITFLSLNSPAVIEQK